MFLDSFHERTLERFFHREHLRLAWNIIREHGLDQGLSILAQGIKEFTEEQGTANQYHETLTMFWGRIIDHAIQERPDVQRFEEFLNTFPFLLEKDLPTRHWTSARLWSDAARQSWLLPDKLPLPISSKTGSSHP